MIRSIISNFKYSYQPENVRPNLVSWHFKDIGKGYMRFLAKSKISVALTKLEFKVQVVSAFICKQCYGR